MDVFVLEGSKGGAGRTASSVILAQGFARLGLETLHLQVTISGVTPAIAFADGLPFKAAWLLEGPAGPFAIEAAIADYAECSVAVIDMTRWGTLEGRLKGKNVLTLLPVRHSPAEIDVAILDYRGEGIIKKRNRASISHSKPRLHPCALLPITWPEGTTSSDIVTQLKRFDDPTRAGQASPELLMPGIPEFFIDELNDLINTRSSLSSPAIDDAAINIAKAALQMSAIGRSNLRPQKR